MKLDRYKNFTETNDALADIPELRPVLQNYFACGDKDAERADFFSLNVYEWCGESSYDGSGYAMLQKNASDYNLPLFVSETGCRIPQPRLFDDQAAILGNKMSDTWSGTIVYEWITEENDYGLISYGIIDSCTVLRLFANIRIRPKGGPGEIYRCSGRVP